MFQYITWGSSNSSSQKLEKTTEMLQILWRIPLTSNRPTARKQSHTGSRSRVWDYFFPVPKCRFGNRHFEILRTNAASKGKTLELGLAEESACVSGQSYQPSQHLLPMPSQCHVTHVQECHRFQMLLWHSCFPNIPSRKAWLFLWARHIEVFSVFHMVCRCKHMQEMEKSYLRNVDTHARTLPSSASLFLRAVAEDILWGYTWAVLICRPAHCLGASDAWKMSWANAKTWLQCRGLVWRKQGCDAQRGAWPDRPQSISVGRCKHRPLKTTRSALLQSQGKRGKSMEESRTAAAYSTTDLSLMRS